MGDLADLRSKLPAGTTKPFDLADTTFFLGRERLFATERPGMVIWRERLFARLSCNALGATDFFHVPTDRVVEIGTQIEL